MDIQRAGNFHELRSLARRRLPKIAFDYVDGGTDDGDGLTHNVRAFATRRLLPRYLIDATAPDLSASLFGRRYALPVGIAPTGAAALCRAGGDLMLARAARAADIPFVMSGVATATMEELAQVAPDHSWYQLYLAEDRNIPDDMVRRAGDCGFGALVLTVDVPGRVTRGRSAGMGLPRPVRASLLDRAEVLRHPGWLVEHYLRGGRRTAANWAPYAPRGAGPRAVLRFFRSQFPTAITWSDIERLRRLWPRTFIVKGILHPDDARQAAEAGVDGLIISNHGGRQLDRAPAPIEMLPAIRDAAGERLTLMLDSGIRRGSDIVTALCLGARFVFVGRWTLYGLAAGGEAGARHALGMIGTELRSAMTQIGAPAIADLGPHFVLQPGP